MEVEVDAVSEMKMWRTLPTGNEVVLGWGKQLAADGRWRTSAGQAASRSLGSS